MVRKQLKRFLEPGGMLLMVVGVLFMIQPAVLPLFRVGFNMFWIGLIDFMVISHF